MLGEPDVSLIGRTVAGKFAIEGFLGSGAMGTVFRAKQVALDKIVAIKVMDRELSRDPMFAGRFLREAKAASRIDHPNSLRVIDFGEEPDGVLYMAMEFLSGRDLFAVLGKAPMASNERIVDLLAQILAALAAAHDAGVVHRDLKPENIMVLPWTDDEGQVRDLVKVCDFGIAKLIERADALPDSTEHLDGPRLTTKGLVVGTPEYMSPEQGRGEPLDARSDLYSVGVILFQMLTGKVPFEANTPLGIVLKHVTDEPPLPRTIVPGVHPRLEAICMKALRKKQAERFQSAREMRSELKAALGLPFPTGSLPATPTPEMVTPAVPVADTLLANAATALAIDSSAVRAATPTRRPSAGPDASEELPELDPPRPRRTGFVVAGLLLSAVLALVAVKLTPHQGVTPRPEAPDAALATAASTPTVPDWAASATPVASMPPQPSSAPVLAPSLAPPPSSASPATSGSARPKASGSASASGAPSASAAPAGSAAPGAFDPARAHVVQVAVHPSNTTAQDVQKALDYAAFSRCYRDSLKDVPSKPPVGKARLHVESDEAGKVAAGNVVSDKLPAATGQCMVQVVMGKTIRAADGTGVVSADVDLMLIPE